MCTTPEVVLPCRQPGSTCYGGKLMNYRVSIGALIVFGAAALLAACSSSTTVPSNLGLSDAPDWVNQGNQALTTRDGSLIHGVGVAPAMNDLSLQMSTADQRARAKVARVLSSFMKVVSTDYAAARGQGSQQRGVSSVSRQIENLTRQNVSGARIIAHWRNPKTGKLWSLAELNLNRVKDMVAHSKTMNAGFKRYFAQHADNVFDGFAMESN